MHLNLCYEMKHKNFRATSYRKRRKFLCVIPSDHKKIKNIQMKKFKSEDLINQPQADVKQIILATEHLQTADPIKLTYKSEKDQWSVVQVLEHLNAYNRHYLPLIEKSMVHITKDVSAWFIPGFWGNYFVNAAMPR